MQSNQFSFTQRNMQILIRLLPIFISFSLFSQNTPVNPLSVRSIGLGNASVSFNDINSLFNNQAGLADLEKMGFLFSGQETFRSPNSDNLGVGFAMPSSFGTFGINLNYYESNNLIQIKTGLTYARKLMEKISIGIQFDMLTNQFLTRDRINLFTIEIGLQFELTENLLVGIHLFNPAKLEIIKDEFLPTILRTGAIYTVSKKVLIHAELKSIFNFPLIFNSGMEFELVNNLWLRLGYHTKPNTFNAGIGYLFKNGIRIDLAGTYQQGLELTSSSGLGYVGFVPSIGLGYDFIKQ